MPKNLIIAVLLSFVLFPFASFAHGGDEARVEIEPEVAATVSAGKIDYIFELVDNVQKIPLTDRDLNVEMTKLLHFIAYDEALAEFQHVHPAFKNGQWHVELNFSKSGTYWLWAQGQVKNGGVDFAASSQLTITGGQSANPTPPTLSDRRKGNDRNSVVTLSNDVIHAGKMAMLMLTYSRNDGSKPEITPYLGALAHITAVSDDGDSMVHVHPMGTALPNQLMVHTQFATAGLYRVWVEFVDGGTKKLVPLAVEVQP